MEHRPFPARLALLVAPLFVAPSLAQTPAGDDPAVPISAKEDPSPATQVDGIIKEYDDKMQAFYGLYQQTKGEEAREQLYMSSYPNPGPYAEQLMAIVNAAPADPASARAIVWVLQNTNAGDKKAGLLAVLLKHHLASEEIAAVCGTLAYDEDVTSERFLLAVIEANHSHENVGQATFALCSLLAERINTAENLGEATVDALAPRYDKETAELLIHADLPAWKARHRALLETVRDQFGDVQRWNSTLGQLARGALFEMDYPQIGMLAPDVGGPDLDGVNFKLSDYRGQVVFLDFWGDW
ncbi:MAG: hypothetical protein KDB61_11630 [Planctomycetes bacterium]|nr:hypothetical protein [Planctomycetota bacterium]